MREAQADKGDDVKPAAGLSNKSYSYDFTPVRICSDRGDFQFRGVVRQPLQAGKGAVPYFAIQMLTRFFSTPGNGWAVSPLPSALMREAAIPAFFSAAATLSARSLEIFRLTACEPVEIGRAHV